MNLDAARKRHGKPRRRQLQVVPSGGLPAEINVTPLVDVVLVLLIIFMVVTPLVEKELQVLLPSERHTDQPAEANQQLIVTLAADGTLQLNGAALPAQAYQTQLSAQLAARNAAERVVFVVAEDGASYRALVDVIAGAKRAGASSVGVVP